MPLGAIQILPRRTPKVARPVRLPGRPNVFGPAFVPYHYRSFPMRAISLILISVAALSIWTGCEAHVTTDSPPPRTVDVQVDPPPRVDVDVTRKPGADVDVNVKR